MSDSRLSGIGNTDRKDILGDLMAADQSFETILNALNYYGLYEVRYQSFVSHTSVISHLSVRGKK
jgi:hypothetical protein